MKESKGRTAAPGRSGYSKDDEKAAKAYGKLDAAYTRGSPLPASERAHRAKSAPANYLSRTKTAEGREVNRKNVDFMKAEVAKRKGK